MRYININEEFPHLQFLPWEEDKFVRVHISKIVGLSRDLDLDFVGTFDGFFSNKENFEEYCKIDQIHLIEYQGKYYVCDNGNKRVLTLKNIGHRYEITEVWARVTKFISTEETERQAREKYEEWTKSVVRSESSFKDIRDL